MIKENVEKIFSYASGMRAYRTIEKLTTFHRITASPGYRQAAVFCQKTLADAGIEAKILSFPSNERTCYWTNNMFKEWEMKGGFLDLTYPKEKRLCDFNTNCNSIMARSGPIDADELEIVLLDDGPSEENYEGLDLRGKLILVDSEPRKYRWATVKRGAVGIIAERMWDMDGFRPRYEMAEARQSMSFSWSDEENDVYACGFVLSAALGDELRSICRKMEDNYKKGKSKDRYPKVRAHVDSRFYDGYIENVTAVIPGETDEEIIVVAHLCHPKTSANDNASGVAGAMEVMRTLNDLIIKGELPKPRRSIRMMLMPEFNGTYAYMATNEGAIDLMKAGINLDMIGGSQRDNGCCTVITDAPDACPSFVHDVACLVLDEIKKDASMVDDGDIGLYNYKPIDYVPQSDHFIYSDPSVGVPMLMMLQWPDKYYHTSFDTIEKIDPEVLKRNITVAAGYLYTLADLKKEDVPVILGKLNERLVYRITQKLRKASEAAKGQKELAEERDYYRDLFTRKACDIKRFFSVDEMKDMAELMEREKNFITMTVDRLYSAAADKPANLKDHQGWEDDKYSKVPVKLFRGPVSPYNFFSKLKTKAEKDKLNLLMDKYGDIFEVCDYATYRIDGANDIRRITNCMAMETGVDNIDFVYDYIEFLAELGVVRFVGEDKEVRKND